MQTCNDIPQRRTELASLFERYAPGLLMYARMHLPLADGAEDVIVEVFVTALENERFAELGEREQLLWLWRATRNKTIDAYRAHRRRLVVLEAAGGLLSESTASDPEAMALQHEDLAVIHLSLLQLPAGQQEVLRLHFGQGLTPGEVAIRLGKQENAIRVALSRGLNILRCLYSQGKQEPVS